jgi:hypothetical protein
MKNKIKNWILKNIFKAELMAVNKGYQTQYIWTIKYEK